MTHNREEFHFENNTHTAKLLSPASICKSTVFKEEESQYSRPKK